MHLIKDENGNMVPHGHSDEHVHEHVHADGSTHVHSHSHESGHDHEHTHSHQCSGCGEDGCNGCTEEVVALLNYMLSHNEHHAEELDQMAENIAKLDMQAASKLIKDAVSEFQKGNMKLSLALTLVKEHLKEA